MLHIHVEIVIVIFNVVQTIACMVRLMFPCHNYVCLELIVDTAICGREVRGKKTMLA